MNHDVSWINTSPAIVDGVAVLGSSDARFVHAVDVLTGAEKWRVSTASVVWASPSVAGTTVYAAEGAGILRAIDHRTGIERWQWRAGGALFSSPAIADSALYIGSDDGGVYAVALTAGPPLRRAVFWDSASVGAAFFRGHAAVRTWLTDRGYELLDAAALPRWLQARTDARERSVVVFALDALPATVVGAEPASGAFRRYLDAGGKIVWLGVPPLLWPRRPDGGLALADVDRTATQRLLGVVHERGNFDPSGTAPTPVGRRWGLGDWWPSNWSATPASVTEVLARDDEGLAASWIRAYGGPPGTGFVRLYGVEWGGPWRGLSLLSVQVAAEFFPR